MWFLGRRRGADLIGKLTALQRQGATRDTLGQLYAILSTLDSKATGLLTVDALIIAVLAAFRVSSEFTALASGSPRLSLLIDIQLTLSVISALLCLLVVHIAWRFYAWVPNAPAEAADFDREIERLANAIDDRTLYYQFAWRLAVSVFIVTPVVWVGWWWIAIAAIVLGILDDWTRLIRRGSRVRVERRRSDET